MKNNFHNDVNNENLNIANKIYEDSKKFSDIDCPKPDLEDIINCNKPKPKQTFKKGYKYAISSAIAACLVFATWFGAWQLKINEKKVCTPIYLSKKNVATDYSEIYERLMKANATNFAYEKEYMLYEKVEKSDSNTTPLYEGQIAADTAQTTTGTSSNNSLTSENEGGDFYNTNEQTENVHEGDIVKTDGKYIYSLKDTNSKFSSKLYITKVNGTDMDVVKRMKISFGANKKDNSTNKVSSTQSSYTDSISYAGNHASADELYLYDNTLVVIGTYYDYGKKNNHRSSAITYVYIYDVSVPEKITLTNKLSQDGHYVSSRMKNNFLYTVTSCGIDSPSLDYCVPKINGELMSPECVYLPDKINSGDYTVITGLDVTKSEEFVTSQSVLGGSSNIYASQENIYVINTIYDEEDITNTKSGKDIFKKAQKYNFEIYNNKKITLTGYLKNTVKSYLKDSNIDAKVADITAYKNTVVIKNTNRTEIIKFNYTDGEINFISTNTIDGHTEDNLNFDEKDGYLRCVTTENSHTNVETLVKCYDKKGEFLFEFPYFTETIIPPEDTNNVFVLDKELGITAEINNLAKGESIYSARYLDDYGYFVTYEETDPLFTIDFSDMENPKIIGELKMPGYSEYLHFYGPNMLLGFGLEESSTWRNPDKLKLEMFNVEHGKAKKEAKTLLDKYSYSLSMYNYKALMVDPKRNLIGFAAEEEIISKYDWDYKQYYVVYSYQNKSFEELYRIKITKNAYDVRGFYIGDYLYIVCPEYGIYSINMKTYNKNEKVEYVHFK